MPAHQKLVIRGGRRIEGEIPIQGAKNSALPLLAASVLCTGQTTLYNCPKLTDCDAACRILTALGCSCRREGGSVSVNASAPACTSVSAGLMREMRSSVIFLGAVLARHGEAEICFPGGCRLGPRPIDMHLDALERLNK